MEEQKKKEFTIEDKQKLIADIKEAIELAKNDRAKSEFVLELSKKIEKPPLDVNYKIGMIKIQIQNYTNYIEYMEKCLSDLGEINVW